MSGKSISSCFRRLLYIGAVVISFLMLTGLSFAQEKSGQILQQLERKEIVPKETPRPVIEKNEKKEETPEKTKDVTEGKKVFIRQIRVNGSNLLNTQTLQDIIRNVIHSAAHPEARRRFLVNRELSFSQMNQIVQAITTHYRKLGYIVAYAFLPQQKIKDGTLEIGVKEGKTGDITVTGNTSYSTAFIKKHLERIKKEPSPREDTLERALLILNDYPSLNVKVQLKAGKEPETTDMTAEAKDRFPISGNLSYDNFGESTSSKNRLSAALNMGNLVMSGDQLMLRGLTGIDRLDIDKLAYGRAEYLFPINDNGTKIGIHYSNAVYKIGDPYESLEINGKAHWTGLYITHPVIKKSDRSLDARFGFDYKDIYDYMLGEIMSKDKIRVFNLGATYEALDSLNGKNVINLTWHHGVRSFLGGSGQNDTDSSRLYGDGEFNKLTADMTRVQKLPGYNHLLLRAAGQFSNDRLFVAEQFMIGGAYSVRGFRPSSLSGDSGYLLSAELHLSPIYPDAKILNQKVGETIKFVLFADNGWVYKNDVQPGEEKSGYQTSLGTGLRLYFGKYFYVRLDLAVPQIEGAFNTKDGEVYLLISLSL